MEKKKINTRECKNKIRVSENYTAEKQVNNEEKTVSMC